MSPSAKKKIVRINNLGGIMDKKQDSHSKNPSQNPNTKNQPQKTTTTPNTKNQPQKKTSW
jgi:hypothetical protein